MPARLPVCLVSEQGENKKMVVSVKEMHAKAVVALKRAEAALASAETKAPLFADQSEAAIMLEARRADVSRARYIERYQHYRVKEHGMKEAAAFARAACGMAEAPVEQEAPAAVAAPAAPAAVDVFAEKRRALAAYNKAEAAFRATIQESTRFKTRYYSRLLHHPLPPKSSDLCHDFTRAMAEAGYIDEQYRGRNGTSSNLAQNLGKSIYVHFGRNAANLKRAVFEAEARAFLVSETVEYARLDAAVAAARAAKEAASKALDAAQHACLLHMKAECSAAEEAANRRQEALKASGGMVSAPTTECLRRQQEALTNLNMVAVKARTLAIRLECGIGPEATRVIVRLQDKLSAAVSVSSEFTEQDRLLLAAPAYNAIIACYQNALRPIVQARVIAEEATGLYLTETGAIEQVGAYESEHARERAGEAIADRLNAASGCIAVFVEQFKR